MSTLEKLNLRTLTSMSVIVLDPVPAYNNPLFNHESGGIFKVRENFRFFVEKHGLFILVVSCY